MRITVWHGSPKGTASLSLRYLQYLERKLPQTEFDVHHIGRDLGKLEKDPALFDHVLNAAVRSDGVLWLTPVFYFLVPSPLKRFMELLFERGASQALAGKYSAALTTSARLSDHTAMNYIQAVSEDLGMNFVDGWPAEVNDLLDGRQRKNLVTFGRFFLRHIEEGLPTPRRFPPLDYRMPEYRPGEVRDLAKDSLYRLVLLTDAREEDVNLRRMIGVFLRRWPGKAEVVNLRDMDMSDCRSCLACTWDGTCIQKDEFSRVLENSIMPAEALVYAGTVNDRYLSSRWKMFFDRCFVLGHRPVLRGKQAAFLISGPLSRLPNLRQIFEVYAQTFGLNIVGMVSDEEPEPPTGLLTGLADSLHWSLENAYQRQVGFLGLAAHKILRDLAFISRFFWKANHKYYRSCKLYDFPQKIKAPRVMNAIISPLLLFPGFRKKFYPKINSQMIKPLDDLLARVKHENID